MKKYAIDKDFFLLSFLTIRIQLWFIFTMNFFIALQCRLLTPKSGITWKKETLSSDDGQRFDITLMQDGAISANKKPLIIYYHGGAFALGCSATHMRGLEYYVKQTGAVGLMVDYRLMPKHVFPAGFNDCYQALAWAVEHADRLGIDSQKIVLMGDSAGGCLAAGVAQKSRDMSICNILAQVLIYPVLDCSCSTETARNFTDVPVWTTKANVDMWDMYLQSQANDLPDYVSPTFGQLHRLPPCYIETAEFDPLRNEGENYAEALDKADVDVEVNATAGTVHGFDVLTYSPISQQAMLARVVFLRKCFL